MRDGVSKAGLEFFSSLVLVFIHSISQSMPIAITSLASKVWLSVSQSLCCSAVVGGSLSMQLLGQSAQTSELQVIDFGRFLTMARFAFHFVQLRIFPWLCCR